MVRRERNIVVPHDRHVRGHLEPKITNRCDCPERHLITPAHHGRASLVVELKCGLVATRKRKIGVGDASELVGPVLLERRNLAAYRPRVLVANREAHAHVAEVPQVLEREKDRFRIISRLARAALR